MKFIIKAIIALFIINGTFFIKTNAQIAVNTDGSDPDASAILDIKSTTSGLLIPRLTTTQRNTMPSKVEGLIVYDTDLQSYMLYDNSTWYSFRNYGSDANNNTRIYVESSTDIDKVQFYRGNTNQFTIQRTGNGDAELLFENADDDIFIGRNTTGITTDGSNIRNVLIGLNAGVQDYFIQNNVIVGHNAATKQNTYRDNVIMGYEAINGSTVTTSGLDDNVIMGYQAGYDLTKADNNVIIGYKAGHQFSGTENVIIGDQAGNNLNDADDNVIIGIDAAQNLQADYNVCIGERSGQNLTTGQYNTIIGNDAGRYAKGNSAENVLVGNSSGKYLEASFSDPNDLSFGHTMIGYYTGSDNNFVGTKSIFIGYRVAYQEEFGGRLYIDNNGTTTPLIYGVFHQNQVRIYGTLNINGEYTFPAADGTNGQIMNFDNSGNGYWSDYVENISQTFSKSGNSLVLSGGGSANLSTYQQSLSLSSNTLSISAGNSVDLSIYDQTLSLSGNTLTISNGNSVTLPFSTSSMHLGNHTATQTLKTNGHWISPDGTDKGIFITASERVSINSSSNQNASLYVSGSNLNYTGQRGRINSGGCSKANSSYGSISIWATDGFIADKFFATSDERIKNIQGLSDNEEDLATLMQIEITDYTYIDTVSKGSTPQKKVIAQQVAKVFSQAVTTNNIEVLPNIMQMATIENGWVSFNDEFRIKNYELKIGDKVKIVFENHDELVEVLEIKDDAFKIKQATGNGQQETVFIYGTQVNDFHTVDYDALSMLNVSATQALTKRNKTLQQKQNRTNSELESLEIRASKIDVLEAILLEMKAKKEQ